MLKRLSYFILYMVLAVQTFSVNAQSPETMWSVIDKEDIPIDVLDQAFIDLQIDFYENGGPVPLYVRWIYFLKFHPEKAEKFGYWNDSIAVALPREPDSTEIVHLSLEGPGFMGYTTSDSTKFKANGTNPDYPLSTMQFSWRDEGNEPGDKGVGGGFSNMPKRYEVLGFKNSSEFGFLIQFVDEIFHPEIVGTNQIQKVDFGMFPNPTAGDILQIILSNENRSASWLVKIYAADGRFIRHQLITGERLLELSVSGLTNGAYILTLSDGDKIGALPFIKT